MSLVQLLRDHYQQCAHGPIIGVERAGTALGSDVPSPAQVAIGTNGTMLLDPESGAAPTRSYVEQDLVEVLDGHVRGAGSAFVGLRLLERSGREWPCPQSADLLPNRPQTRS
ncbi:MAG TPA: hypothetical protein H9836_10650 [Candidatus Nocardiopsis merdipullorum]|nr:hypothetical protein [Candidatus Nocardiopsis merdipullorum]